MRRPSEEMRQEESGEERERKGRPVGVRKLPASRSLLYEDTDEAIGAVS